MPPLVGVQLNINMLLLALLGIFSFLLVHASPEIESSFDDSTNDSKRLRDNAADAVRALATFAPPAQKREVEHRAGGAGVILSGDMGQRSLNEWEIDDFVLLATVDGTLHARERKSGARRWEVFADDPVVQTIYHRANNSDTKEWIPDDNVFWIVEPVQDGALFFFTPDNGLQVFSDFFNF
jgi:serine/threonine-protein kinase/endoribonuclease IRE1